MVTCGKEVMWVKCLALALKGLEVPANVLVLIGW